MKVHRIIGGKSEEGVVGIAPDATVSEAARMLSERRIGALMVSRDGRTPMGILSERDIVRELGRRGASCMDDPVEALMTRDVVGCSRDDEADAVLGKMTEGRFRHMPVMEDGAMTGLISIGDVVKARLAELAAERDALQDMVMGH